ncbi:MAG: rRNA adenine dimethyltransferase family protein [bacterium]|nr:rRNA adenine dimethyltransferase family protein [bacterium]
MSRKEAFLKGADLTEQFFKPNEALGQHILIDETLLKTISEQVVSGANVIEIGVGPGNLTKNLAKRASLVFGLEIDARFEDTFIDKIGDQQNVTVRFADALKVDYMDDYIKKDPEALWQIVSSLPFHISEPFIKKISQLPIYDAILLVGDSLANTLSQTDPNSPMFTRQSLLAHTYFDIEQIADVDKNAFWPPPRTDASLIRLSPRNEFDYSSLSLAILKSLFDNEHTNQTVRKGILTAAAAPSGYNIDKYGGKIAANRASRRKDKEALRLMARTLIGESTENLSSSTDSTLIPSAVFSRLNLPDKILDTPFNNLDSNSLRLLARALAVGAKRNK